MSVWDLRNESCSLEGAATWTRHIGFRPGFIKEHESIGIESRLQSFPLGPSLGNIRTILLSSPQDFFFNVSFSFFSARQSVPTSSSVFS